MTDRLPNHTGLVPALVLRDGEDELTVTFDRFENGEWEYLEDAMRYWFELPPPPTPAVKQGGE